MNPNETWKNLLLALREGRPVAAAHCADQLALWIKRNDHLPWGLQAAILALEVSE